jgi:hypothetical protein
VDCGESVGGLGNPGDLGNAYTRTARQKSIYIIVKARFIEVY